VPELPRSIAHALIQNTGASAFLARAAQSYHLASPSPRWVRFPSLSTKSTAPHGPHRVSVFRDVSLACRCTDPFVDLIMIEVEMLPLVDVGACWHVHEVNGVVQHHCIASVIEPRAEVARVT
jgi:hypothetical protein